jgi:hypothetical protein
MNRYRIGHTIPKTPPDGENAGNVREWYISRMLPDNSADAMPIISTRRIQMVT